LASKKVACPVKSEYGFAMAEQTQYRVCPHRNVAAAYERFFRPSGSELVFFYFDWGMQRSFAVAGSALLRVVALTLSMATFTRRLLEESVRAWAAPYRAQLVPRAGVEPA
jgi:hypothetical protein